MKWLVGYLTALVLLLGEFGGRAGANFITNGGFETGDFTGWSVNAGATGVQSSGGLGGYAAHSGSFYAALGNVGGLGTLSQTLSLTPGQSYTLDYFLASNGTTPNEFKTSIDGNVVFDQTNIPTQPYTEYSFTFTATGSSTVIEFGERNDPDYLALDDVSVNPAAAAAPEPASLTLLSIGLVGSLGYGLRRRKKVSASVA